ncbi:DNA mismatch repair endonuclease MutL [Colwelliaceae bacterium 6471]
MTIEILPARLANQIAAGEVVERPASVIKELVENSLDAGATKIQIDIEKGGSKRIRITDNGCGIVKDELTLALSRHATSKIKDLNDLESISSLGFRGEALASISSVARLTLTSKPTDQDAAWQACAEGRDMKVLVQPAAHPNGTTIDVKDLFFNTPARRKFLRTEKTEFTHIEEIIKRIALARFDVTFILAHNGKVVRQYRAAKDSSQYAKRVAQVCGQGFIDSAIEVDCQHDNLHLWGWLAKPDYYRNQNDLCYSYVNGRMMRDKLINHAIRQAYADLLPSDAYPAFVLFLSLDYREVDVNVHPAKHEVRFHQGRYVHDFIYSVCDNALQAEMSLIDEKLPTAVIERAQPNQVAGQSYVTSQDYIKPLTQVAESTNQTYRIDPKHYGGMPERKHASASAAQAYQELMTPIIHQEIDAHDEAEKQSASRLCSSEQLIHFIPPCYGVMEIKNELRLLSLSALSKSINQHILAERTEQGIISQPLLLPVKIKLSDEQHVFVGQHQQCFIQLGIILEVGASQFVKIKQFPALLRHKDVSQCFNVLLDEIMDEAKKNALSASHWQQALAIVMSSDLYTYESAQELLMQAKKLLSLSFEQQLHLNSVVVDLTSEISQLN